MEILNCQYIWHFGGEELHDDDVSRLNLTTKLKKRRKKVVLFHSCVCRCLLLLLRCGVHHIPIYTFFLLDTYIKNSNV